MQGRLDTKDMIHKRQYYKLDIIKTFKFCIPKVRAEPKGIPHTQEKICANHRSDEGLI